MSAAATRVVVLISGRGSNLQSILDQAQSGRLPVELCAVIANNPAAEGLQHARARGIPTEVVDHRDFPDRGAFDTALMQAIDRHAPHLVVLAGFMRILGEPFIHHYQGRLLNIHPSLLPAFKGLNTHARVLQSGARQHGASVHFVTDDLDGGPVIIQASVPVQPNDTVESLAARVLQEEHRILPLAIRWFAENRLSLRHGQVVLDGHIQPAQGLVAQIPNQLEAEGK